MTTEVKTIVIQNEDYVDCYTSKSNVIKASLVATKGTEIYLAIFLHEAIKLGFIDRGKLYYYLNVGNLNDLPQPRIINKV